MSLLTAVAYAEVQTYTGEGSYVMSEGENLGVAKERAKVDAMRNAQEQVGVFVKSFSQTKNFELVDDEVIAIASSVLKLVEEPHFYPVQEVANLEELLIRVSENSWRQ